MMHQTVAMEINREVEQRFENDIQTALLSSKHLKLTLSRIARDYQVDFDMVEQIAQSMLEQNIGIDMQRVEFTKAMRQYQRIEQEIKDPGLREWKIQDLARQLKRTPRQLREAYNKTLCQDFLPKPMSVGAFRERYQQDIDWLIPGWLPVGSTLLLHGDGGAGKTLFAYTILEAVLHGAEWNGYQARRGPCLLIQSDEPPLVTSERLDTRGITGDDPLFILPGWQAEGIDRLDAYLSEIQPKLVIVDSNTAINRSSVFSENDTEYARPILQFADLATRHNCTFIVIHHSNAAGQARGTRAIHNSVSEVWALSVSEGDERTLNVQKTRLGRPPGKYKFAMDSDDFSFHYLGEDRGDGEIEDYSTQEHRIRLWLGDDDNRGTMFAPIEIAERIAMSANVVRRCLRELSAKRVIRKMRRPGQKYPLYYIPKDENVRLETNEMGSSPVTEQDTGDKRSDFQGNDVRLETNEMGSSPVTEQDTGDKRSGDRAIGQKIQHFFKKSERSPDRPIAYPTQTQTEQSLEVDSMPFKKGDRVTAAGVEAVGTYVRPHSKMIFSPASKKLEVGHVILFDDGLKIPVAEIDLTRIDGAICGGEP